MLRGALLTLLLLLLPVSSATADVRSVRTIEPRAFGYFVGDTLERTIEIETGADDEIVTASLPRRGPSNYWLEVRAIAQDSERLGDGRLHTLTFTYQLFYAPIDPRKQTIPALDFTVRGPAGTETVTFPAFTLIMSPIREIFPEKSGETAETFLRPDETGSLRRSGQLRSWFLVSAGLVVLFFFLLARDLAWWPFHRRPARPFSRAAREVGAALAHGSAESYRVALMALHRAFDATSGRRVMASDVERFLAANPQHNQARPLIERFFSVSRGVFFAEAERESETAMPPADLKGLAGILARQERAAR